MINRRRLAALIGAGVLVAVSVACTSQESFKADQTGVASQSDSESAPSGAEKYPLHEAIPSTVFWVGEEADASNDFIDNVSSAWAENWVETFGGIDSPDDRCGFSPCSFKPKENAFYFALPASDYNELGLKPDSELKVIPWYDGHIEEGKSILKNRWIEITYRGKKAYAQWEDVGPFNENDVGYVFGDDSPKELRAGLDMSPAVADFLEIDGKEETSWRFIEEVYVPAGPWRELITRSDPQY